MALTYEDFTAYPIQIIGIDASYNDELTSIEEFVTSEIDYSGDVENLDIILPYFVFFKFCESRNTIVVAQTGETQTTKEFTFPAYNTQIRAWNIGSKMLLALCTEKVKTASKNYQSQISFI